jgi:protein involved in ribonucleotide reduction
MKSIKLSLLFSAAFCLLLTVSAFAQTGTFSDPNVEYTFMVPDSAWKQTVKPSTTSPNVEYVFKERSEGHLEVRKVTVKSGETLADIMSGEEQRLQFLPGFVAGKEENFNGEFVRAGRNMSGRFYFLQADANTIYILRFAGRRDNLRSIRNQTDSIARTFTLKKEQ